VTLGAAGLWWRLASGPIQLDVVTPWLVAAIEENFGNGHHVEVGGTQIEHTESGGTAVRIRDIVVRDSEGAVVASAPKAEVRVSSLSLLRGHIRAESLNLVGAETAVRIDDFRVDMAPQGTLLILRNQDVPGVIGRVGSLLGNAGINIAGYHQSRLDAGGDALAVVKVDSRVDPSIIDALGALPEVHSVRHVRLDRG